MLARAIEVVKNETTRTWLTPNTAGVTNQVANKMNEAPKNLWGNLKYKTDGFEKSGSITTNVKRRLE